MAYRGVVSSNPSQDKEFFNDRGVLMSYPTVNCDFTNIRCENSHIKMRLSTRIAIVLKIMKLFEHCPRIAAKRKRI